MNQLTTTQNNLPATYEAEADNLLAVTQGHEKLLKFVKGRYKIMDDEVPLGTQYVAHANQLTFSWIKFADGKVADRRMGKAVDKWVPPRREDLPDTDTSQWEIGLDGKPKDPWSFQHLLPFEHLENGELVIFVTSSIGGKIAIEELVKAYATRLKRKGSRALPIVKLASKDMPTKAFGDVPRPFFEIEGWEDDRGNEVVFYKARASAAAEPDDTIPF